MKIFFIDLFAVSGMEHEYHEHMVIYLTDNPVIAYPVTP